MTENNGTEPAKKHEPKRQSETHHRPLACSRLKALESYEAAALLDACELVQQTCIPLRAITATVLMTGGRLHEVLGLEVGDIDFEHRIIRFQENKWRRPKTGDRAVPLGLQLEAELTAYLSRHAPTTGLLFPSTNAGGERPLVRTVVAAQIERAASYAVEALGSALGRKLRAKQVTESVLRKTYLVARLRSAIDEESMRLVKRELGSGALGLIQYAQYAASEFGGSRMTSRGSSNRPGALFR